MCIAYQGGGNFLTFGGNYGDTRFEIEKGGAFAVPNSALKDYAVRYPDYCIYKDGEFRITDFEKFGEEVLSGVPLETQSGAYLIYTNVPINVSNISMPSVMNNSAYAPYFVSGGKLLSGQTETTIIPMTDMVMNSSNITDLSISGMINDISYEVKILQ